MDEILIKAGGFLFMIALGFVLKRIGLFSLDDSGFLSKLVLKVTADGDYQELSRAGTEQKLSDGDWHWLCGELYCDCRCDAADAEKIPRPSGVLYHQYGRV